MTQKETPSPRPEQPTLSESVLLERAQDIQEALDLQSTDGWQEWMKRVQTLPADPGEAKTGPIVRVELDRRFQELLKKREMVLQALASVLIFVSNKTELSPMAKNATKRHLAELLNGLAEYEILHRGAGTIGRSPGVPEALTHYLLPNEEQKTALRITEILLPMQYDVMVDQGVSPRHLAQFSSELAMTSRNVRLQTVLACLDSNGKLLKSDKPYEEFIQIAGYPSWSKEDVQAARLLIGYIGKHLPTIKEYMEFSRRKTEEITITEALECCSGMQALGEVTDKLAQNVQGLVMGQYPDLRSFIRDTLSNNDLYPARIAQMALSPLAKLTPDAEIDDREKAQRNLQAVVLFLLDFNAKRARVTNVEIHLGVLKSEEQKNIVRALCAEIQSETMIRSLLRASLVPGEDKDRSKPERKAVQHLAAILREGKLSLRDAFEIYYFSHTPGGDLPLAFKAANLLEEHGHPEIASEFQMSRFSKITDMALSGAANFDDALEKIDVTEDQKRELGNIRQYLLEAGLESASRLWNRIWLFHKYYPFVALCVDASVSTPFILLGRRLYIKYNVTALEQFANKGIAQLRSEFKLTQIADDQIRMAQKEALAIVSEYDRLVLRWHLFRGRKLLRSGYALMEAARTSDLSEMAKALRMKYPQVEDVAHALAGLAPDHTSMRDALRYAGFAADEIDTALNTMRFNALAKESTDMLKELQRTETLPGTEKIAPVKALQQRSRMLRDAVNELCETMPDARRKLAQNLAEPGIELSDEFFAALEEAHSEKSIRNKMKIFHDKLPTSFDDGMDISPENAQKIACNKQERALAKRMMRLGLAGENPEAAKLIPRNLDELTDAIRGATSFDDASDLLRAFSRTATELDPVAYAKLLKDDHLNALAKAAGKETELVTVRKATESATKTVSRSKLLKAGGILTGAGLIAFGVIVDGILIHQTNLEIADAEKRGDTQRIALLQSKRRSQAGEAAFGLGTGSLGMAGVLTGPPGWVALGGIMAKSVSSEYLYNYAEDLNKTELKEFLKRTPEELIALLHGKGNWMIDAKITREHRYELGLDAYILKTQSATFTALDDRYMKEVIFELPTWQDKNPYDPKVRAAAEKVVMEEKTAKFRIAVAEFLKETGGFESPSPRRLELATAYANLKYLERRAQDLGDPTILHDVLYKIGGYIPAEGTATVEPGDLLDDVKEHRAARILDQEKAGSLFYRISMLKTLVEEGEMPKEVARVEFLKEFSASLLAHDGTLFLKEMAEKSNADRFAHEQTINQILVYEIGPLFDKAIENPEAFAQKALALRDSIRTFLASSKPFTLEEMDDGGTSFGRKLPKWYRKNALGIVRG